MKSRITGSRIPTLFLIPILLLPGCSNEDDPTATVCPGPSIESLTPVENLSIADDPILHATVTLAWSSPLPNPADLAVVSFVIKADPSGRDITSANWCDLPLLGTFPAEGKLGFFARFDHDNEAIVPGATETFAVRPLYENGDLGPVGTVLTHRMTAPFMVEGLVRDDTGEPVPGITVRLVKPVLLPPIEEITLSAVTGPDGRFIPLGPISDQVAMVVATDSPDTLTTPEAEDSYFDFTTEPLMSGPLMQDISLTLVTRYVFDHKPGGYVADYFLSWVQVMVNASHIESEYRIRKWESYDLKIYVPEGMNEAGTIDLAAVCRNAMERWNSALELTVFTETDDPELAQVEVVFKTLQGSYGQVLLDKPEGYHFNGRVIPERAIMEVDPVMDYLPGVEGIILHEFGHILGIIRHSTNSNHLMSPGSSCCLGRDELRLVHTIINLPQNCLLSNYEKGLPWPFP